MIVELSLLLMGVIYFIATKILIMCKGAAVFVLFFVPILLTCYWITEGAYDYFSWLKLYSVLTFLWILLLINTLNIPEKKRIYFQFILYFLLQINIFEAVFLDFNQFHLSNVFFGVILMVTLPSWNEIKIKPNDALAIYWNIPLYWIFAYTIWNWLFVHFQFVMLAGIHFFLLLIPLIVSLFDRTMWIYYRSHSLGFHLILIFSFPYGREYFYTEFTWLTMQQSMMIEIIAGSFLLMIFIISKLNSKNIISVEGEIQ